ncbi:MAG: hypothetical protein IJA67_05250 [Oscillospiraceae bacterium]|nr:hypothetical protein [Oscillospiraceae bacterium]
MQAFATLMQPSTAGNATLSLQNGNCINDIVMVEEKKQLESDISELEAVVDE